MTAAQVRISDNIRCTCLLFLALPRSEGPLSSQLSRHDDDRLPAGNGHDADLWGRLCDKAP